MDEPIDEMTGLLAHRAMAKIDVAPGSEMLMAELDQLKWSNYVIGFPAIDTVLVRTAALAREHLATERIYRWGGNVFLVFCDQGNLSSRAEAWRAAVEDAFSVERQAVRDGAKEADIELKPHTGLLTLTIAVRHSTSVFEEDLESLYNAVRAGKVDGGNRVVAAD